MANICHGVHGPCENSIFRDQHGHGSDQEARFAAKGHARENRHGNDRLELRQHEERGAPRHIQRNEHGDEHQFPRLRLVPLENQEEWQHTFEQNQQRNEVIFSPREVVYADKQRQRNQKQDEQCGSHGALFQLALFHGRLNQVIRTFGLPANGQCKHKKCSNQNAVELELPACQRRHTVCVHRAL
ncbi:MAG: hypothetical protein ACLUFI_14330 [Oscillospiraceae bacterium]